jgi:hypothetical protein
MLKLVIDTNVVISALLKPESNPALIMSYSPGGFDRPGATTSPQSRIKKVRR